MDSETATTFRGGSYTEKITKGPTILYRAYSQGASRLGGFWSRDIPKGPTQARLDSALNPEWRNKADAISKIEVPPGTKIYEGTAAPQRVFAGGTLPGGGNQIVFKKGFEVPKDWLR